MKTSEMFGVYTKLEHHEIHMADIVVVNWCMGNTCNFACSYCPPSLHSGNYGWYDYDRVLHFCDRIIAHYAAKTIYFEFTGGEVTLWKHFPDLCKYLQQHGCKVGFISNSSRTVRWWEDIIPHVNHVCLSFHPEAGDKEHFKTVAALTSRHFKTHLNVMMLPERFDELYEFALELTQFNNISMALQPLLINFGEQVFPYTDDQKLRLDQQHKMVAEKIVYDNPFDVYRGAMAMVGPNGQRIAIAAQEFISQHKNDWQGWQCHAGLEQIVVDMDGRIFRGWCRVGGSIGHVLDADLNLPTQTITCNKSRCHCNFDIMCTKENIHV
jgi:organic radical activating enzyme